jgi:23S rRNA (cytidine1920-2'-O)/16S rRNA (cytidine1409-2'-O)-methyltransferase
MTRRRLDAEMVRRSLVDSRSSADRLITRGVVLVSGAVADKSSRLVDAGEPIVVVEPPRFVSRGGEKLDAALDYFAVGVHGLRALDAGASTGGFTDCLLQRGAAHVVALDVGHGQLHPRIRQHPDVTVFERCHVRDVTPDTIGGAVDLVVADLSFISLRSVLAQLAGTCTDRGTMVLLVKPQFEAGRAVVSKGRGVITDPAVHDAVCASIDAALADVGCDVHGWVPSPILGGDGNREFLVHASIGRAPR